VTRLPWRGQVRRVRMVVYRRANATTARRGQSPEQALTTICDRLVGGLANAGVKARRMEAADIHDWLLRWFNPHPTLLPSADDRERFYALTRYPEAVEDGEIELASGDFAQRLFFGQPRSDVANGTWLRRHAAPGHRDGPAAHAARDGPRHRRDAQGRRCRQRAVRPDARGHGDVPDVVATPQDVLEAHLNHLSKKSVGETLASEQTRRDVQEARGLIGSAHKLYRGALAFYLRGRDLAQLDARGLQLVNVMLNAGLQPVREEDEVAPLNSYLRWLPCVFDPATDKRQWYTQLMFAQHAANRAGVGPQPGHRQSGHHVLQPRRRADHLRSAEPARPADERSPVPVRPHRLGQERHAQQHPEPGDGDLPPRLFIVEAGNSFGLFGDFAARLGMKVHRVKLAPVPG
jgi:hypothetical protein